MISDSVVILMVFVDVIVVGVVMVIEFSVQNKLVSRGHLGLLKLFAQRDVVAQCHRIHVKWLLMQMQSRVRSSATVWQSRQPVVWRHKSLWIKSQVPSSNHKPRDPSTFIVLRDGLCEGQRSDLKLNSIHGLWSLAVSTKVLTDNHTGFHILPEGRPLPSLFNSWYCDA